MGPLVLEIVVSNSVLDLGVIGRTIRSLSTEFRVIGDRAMVEHASFHQALKKVNSEFKFHYCSLCEKPHVADGSWDDGDLCHCRLDESLHAQEIQRRMRLRAVGDPRQDPLFAALSTKTKFIRMVRFASEFSEQAMIYMGCSGWLYRLTGFPLIDLNLTRMKQWNETGFNFLSACILVDVLRKEFSSVGPHHTTLLDMVLEIFAADQSEGSRYQELLNDDAACLEKYGMQATNELIHSISLSFFEILSLHAAGNSEITLGDSIKNLGNSIGTFLTDESETNANVNMFLKPSFIQDMIRQLPETFVWMPIYGGRAEDYSPPVNRFAGSARQSSS